MCPCTESSPVETGFYWLQSRYYDPAVGRWLSPEHNVDQGGFDTGAELFTHNIYAYCKNNPVMYKDYSGEFIITTLMICVVVGAVIGGTIGGVAANHYANSKGLEGKDKAQCIVAGILLGALIVGTLGYFAALAVVAVTGVSGVSITAAGVSLITTTGTAGTIAFQPIVQSISHTFRSFTLNNFRYNLQVLTGKTGNGLQAHHVLPQQFADKFSRVGLNINDPRFGAWVGPDHQRWSWAYK